MNHLPDPHLIAAGAYAAALVRQGWHPFDALRAAAEALPRPTPPVTLHRYLLLTDGTTHPLTPIGAHR